MVLVADMALLWLWCRLVATALIQPLAREPPYAAKKKPKKKKLVIVGEREESQSQRRLCWKIGQGEQENVRKHVRQRTRCVKTLRQVRACLTPLRS